MKEKSINTTLFSFFRKSNRVSEEKNRIRFDIRYLKRTLSLEQKEKEAETVFSKIESLPEFIGANAILIYWATPDELPTQTFIKKWCNEKALILPSIEGNKLLLKKYSSDIKMIRKALGIFEPDLEDTYNGKIDLVIVPGVAFDIKKNRLGRGKGYYDRFFSKNKTLKIGIGFDFQLLDSIPTNRMDIRMDKIITNSNTIE